MDVKGLQEYEYTPEWNENRTAEKPVSVTMQPLNAMQRERAMEVEVNADGAAGLRPNLSEFVRHGVKEIRGLSVDGVAVKTAAALLASKGAGLEQLVRELGIEVFIANQRPDLKNS